MTDDLTARLDAALDDETLRDAYFEGMEDYGDRCDPAIMRRIIRTRLLAALGEPRGTATWQPIATAPRLGDVVILGCSGDVMMVCRFHGDYGARGPGFVFGYTKDGASQVWWPTHWMPLPAPPVTPTEDR